VVEFGPDGESTEESEEDHYDSEEEQYDQQKLITSLQRPYSDSSDSGCSLFSSSDESICFIWFEVNFEYQKHFNKTETM
jgi:hypothetical protein